MGKKVGGLGLREASLVNMAFFMKLAWNVITNPSAF